MKTVREIVAEQLRADGEINGCPPGTPIDDWFNDADSVLSALKEAGWVCVPVEPTKEMLAAGFRQSEPGIRPDTFPHIWNAMIAASQDQGRE